MIYGISRYVRHLWKVLPARDASACLALAIRLHRQQPALLRPLMIHNDLNTGNLAPGIDGKLIILDFDSVACTRRWIFGDILAYGFNPELKWWIAPELIASYVAELDAEAFEGVCPDAQLRMVLLLRVPQWMLVRKRRNMSYLRAPEFITDVLLDDGAYANWYACLMAQGNAALKGVATLSG